MGHALRSEIVHPGGTYHVWTRGSNQGTTFFADEDRVDFLGRLGHAATKHEWRLLGFCLMSNHYHLVVHIPEGELSEGMQWLNGTFSRRQSRRYGRSAHLWRNRFRVRPVRSSDDGAHAIRYVLRNPAEAGLARTPARWRWSSYGMSVCDVTAAPWFDVRLVHAIFSQFDPRNPALGLRRFVDSGHGLVSDTKPDTKPWHERPSYG